MWKCRWCGCVFDMPDLIQTEVYLGAELGRVRTAELACPECGDGEIVERNGDNEDDDDVEQ